MCMCSCSSQVDLIYSSEGFAQTCEVPVRVHAGIKAKEGQSKYWEIINIHFSAVKWLNWWNVICWCKVYICTYILVPALSLFLQDPLHYQYLCIYYLNFLFETPLHFLSVTLSLLSWAHLLQWTCPNAAPCWPWPSPHCCSFVLFCSLGVIHTALQTHTTAFFPLCDSVAIIT